jgi:hypothetical protein
VSNALFFLGLVVLTVAAFLASVILGLAVVGSGLIMLSLALADGKGLRWR